MSYKKCSLQNSISRQNLLKKSYKKVYLYSSGTVSRAFSMKAGPHQERAPVQKVTQVKATVEITKVMFLLKPTRSS
jgi:hypothetical protein